NQPQIGVRDRAIELIAAELLARDPASYRASIFLSRELLHAKPPALSILDVEHAVQHRVPRLSDFAGIISLVIRMRRDARICGGEVSPARPRWPPQRLR